MAQPPHVTVSMDRQTRQAVALLASETAKMRHILAEMVKTSKATSERLKILNDHMKEKEAGHDSTSGEDAT